MRQKGERGRGEGVRSERVKERAELGGREKGEDLRRGASRGARRPAAALENCTVDLRPNDSARETSRV